MKSISSFTFVIYLSLCFNFINCAPSKLEIDDLEESELQLKISDFVDKEGERWKTFFQPRHGKSSVSSNVKVFKVRNDALGKTLFDEVGNTVDLNEIYKTNEISLIQIPHQKLKPGQLYKRHSISKRETSPPRIGKGRYDYVAQNRTIPQGRGIGESTAEVEVEVGMVFDYANSKLFKFDKTKIVEYLSVLLNGVNTIYKNLENPKIHFVLTGVYIISDEKSQPFVAESKSSNTKSNTIDLMKLLDNYAKWVKKNMKNLPKHDLIPLITGINPEAYNFGLAYLAGACWETDETEDKAMTTSINLDTNGIFESAFTLAHEMGHNLGAPHDGDESSESCPYADGYVMSYEGWLTKNKFLFSECSKTAIKKFVESPAANCLFKKNADKYETMSAKFDGDFLVPGELCKKLTGDKGAMMVQDNIENFCKVVQCEYVEKGTRMWRTYDRPPALNNFPCGIGGHCMLGECIGNKQDPNDDLDLNKKCQSMTHNPNATLYLQDDADAQCQTLKCKLPSSNSSAFTIPIFLAKIPDHSFPCGLLGHCIDGKCEGSQENPDDKLNLHKICVKRTGKSNAVASSEDLEEAKICKAIRCKIPKPTGQGYSLMTFSNPPLEGSFPCKDDKGKCVGGTCVVE